MPVPPSIGKQIAELQEQRLAWALPVPPSIGKQIAELQYTTLNFRAKIMSDNMPIKESLATMDEVFSTIQQEIENSNLVEEAFTIQGYVMNYLDYTIKELQKIYNTLETKKARTILLDIMTIISFILSFKSSIIDSPPEVHIHNKYEDIKIDTEIDGERIDMYIEKKGSLNEEKREQEEGYKWLSGGERT